VTAPTPSGPPPDVPAEVPVAAKESNYSFVPIPEIILDPNEGDTYGLMGVVLFKNEQDEIEYMVAPDVRYNETKGVFPSFRLFGYPTPERRYTIQVGKSTTRDEDYEFEFADRGLLDKKAFFLAKALYERDSTERFFGFGNDSDEDGEANYTGEDLYFDANPGYWVLPHLNVNYRMRIQRYNVQRGQVAAVDDIQEKYGRGKKDSLVGKGLESAVYWRHRIAVAYDTRDSIDMPSEGTYANAYVDGADRNVGSHTSFVAFGFEWRDFIPFRGERRNPILALRAFVDYLQGGTDTPFWLRSSLGGRRALRGFGGDRFIDFNRSLISAELRTRIYERRLFGVKGELELAPFFEVGQVFRHIYDPPLDDPHFVGGLGFRALVRPQIVAFVDVGYGEEGNAIFTGIDYPF
jgi:outer membrane protein assembly factor BamA